MSVTNQVSVVIGGVELFDFEVPDRIPFGGQHATKTHKMVGGARVVDAMGRDDKPLEWSGVFFSSDALDRALMLDAMRQSGAEVSLTWDRLAYTVVIQVFEPVYEYANNIPYSIRCEIVTDDAQPLSAADTTSLDDVVSADSGTCDDLLTDMGTSAPPSAQSAIALITAGFSTVKTAIANVTSLARASVAEIQAVVRPLTAVQSQVADLQGTLNSSILGISSNSVGGMLAGAPNLPAILSGQVGPVQTLFKVDRLANTLGRIAGNLTSAQTSGASVTLVGGSLYEEALAAYGKEDAWTTIAQANGLTDPILSGVNQLVIPPDPGLADGVLSP